MKKEKTILSRKDNLDRLLREKKQHELTIEILQKNLNKIIIQLEPLLKEAQHG